MSLYHFYIFWRNKYSQKKSWSSEDDIAFWKLNIFLFPADGLKEVLVNNYDEINARMEEGTVNKETKKQRNNKGILNIT